MLNTSSATSDGKADTTVPPPPTPIPTPHPHALLQWPKTMPKGWIWILTHAIMYIITKGLPFSTRHFQMHYLKWKCRNFDWDSTEFCSQGPIDNTPALIQIMAWRRPCNKLLFDPKMVSLLAHIGVTRPQWVNKEALGCSRWYSGVVKKLIKAGLFDR